MSLIDARPQHDTFGIQNAILVSRRTDQSVLLNRLNRRGRGQMPPLVSGAVDDAAVALFVNGSAACNPARFVKNWKPADFETDFEIAHEPDNLTRGRSACHGSAAPSAIGWTASAALVART